MSTRFNINIFNNTEAIKIDRVNKVVEAVNVRTK